MDKEFLEAEEYLIKVLRRTEEVLEIPVNIRLSKEEARLEVFKCAFGTNKKDK